MEILGNEPPERRRTWLPERIPVWLRVLAAIAGLLGLGWATLDDPVRQREASPGASRSPVTTPSLMPSESPPVLPDVPSDGRTGLRMLIGDMLYDVDAGTVRAVEGLPLGRGSGWAEAVGKDAVISVDPDPGKGGDEALYVLRHDSVQARFLAKGAGALPAPDGVWLHRWHDEERCDLSKVRLDGSVLRPRRPIDCDISVRAESARGLVAWKEDPVTGESSMVLLRPDDFSVSHRTESQFLVVGRTLITYDSGGLYEQKPGELRKELRRLPVVPGGIEPIAHADADGSRLGFLFVNHRSDGGYQILDFWVYERTSERWLRMPTMPVAGARKVFHWSWTEDGRIVLVGEFERVGLRLVVWRPGEPWIDVRRIAPPPEGSGGLVLRGRAGPTSPR